MEDVAAYCDNITVLSEGKLFMSGSCAEVFEHESELTEMGLGVPQITRFIRMLRDAGVELRRDIYTVEDAVSAIKEYAGRR